MPLAYTRCRWRIHEIAPARLSAGRASLVVGSRLVARLPVAPGLRIAAVGATVEVDLTKGGTTCPDTTGTGKAPSRQRHIRSESITGVGAQFASIVGKASGWTTSVTSRSIGTPNVTTLVGLYGTDVIR